MSVPSEANQQLVLPVSVLFLFLHQGYFCGSTGIKYTLEWLLNSFVSFLCLYLDSEDVVLKMLREKDVKNCVEKPLESARGWLCLFSHHCNAKHKRIYSIVQRF